MLSHTAQHCMGDEMEGMAHRDHAIISMEGLRIEYRIDIEIHLYT